MARVFRIDPETTDAPGYDEALRALRSGGIVVFPTETVYGIGADLRNEEAAARLFALKERARDLPLMAHCSDEAMALEWVQDVSITARLLMSRFWPGPLALVFRRSPQVSDTVTGGGETLGIRMVAHPVGRELIKRLGAPIAGTSANRHGEPATSRFDRLSPALLQGVDVAVDSGVCGSDDVSTVLDMTANPPRLARVGAIPAKAIEEIVGPVAS